MHQRPRNLSIPRAIARDDLIEYTSLAVADDSMADTLGAGDWLSAESDYEIPRDLLGAFERAWNWIRGPGTWWDAAARLAIAAEVRNAPSCPLCRERRAAPSPYAIEGGHASFGVLSECVVEVAHRLRTDSGRLRARWFEEALANGITDGEYVEVAALVASVALLDSFARAVGAGTLPLPKPHTGDPSRVRPSGAALGVAWVPTLEPADIKPGEPNPYRDVPPEHVCNIHRALSLVPTEAIEWSALSSAFYRTDAAAGDVENEYGDLTHAQRELIAARVAALADCFY